MRSLSFVLALLALLFVTTDVSAKSRSHDSAWMAPPTLSIHSDPHQCMAMALYREARGETDRNMAGVGYVIIHRTRSEHFPGGICGVVTQAGQFPWAHKAAFRKAKVNTAQWQRAQLMAILVMTESTPNPVKDSIYFNGLKEPKPSKHATLVVKLGGHAFYADRRIYSSERTAAPEGELAKL